MKSALISTAIHTSHISLVEVGENGFAYIHRLRTRPSNCQRITDFSEISLARTGAVSSHLNTSAIYLSLFSFSANSLLIFF
jgi:hypothetical protein